MNLVVNARDAMPTGGTLIIETSNIDIDASYAATHPEAPVGSCVLLTVTDTGSGIDESTQARIFEPFFTTKELGKGTGLGLATVYGIVKQSGGDITVSSQTDRGTTFQILLPASTGRCSPAPATSPTPTPVAERQRDHPAGQRTTRWFAISCGRCCATRGYTVLEASHGPEALTIAQQYSGSIDLLVTDVVMPQMSGRELAEQLSQARQAGQSAVYVGLYRRCCRSAWAAGQGGILGQTSSRPKSWLPKYATCSITLELERSSPLKHTTRRRAAR